jgi:hypothetical protein
MALATQKSIPNPDLAGPGAADTVSEARTTPQDTTLVHPAVGTRAVL